MNGYGIGRILLKRPFPYPRFDTGIRLRLFKSNEHPRRRQENSQAVEHQGYLFLQDTHRVDRQHKPTHWII